MKTAVSLPDNLFNTAEKAARRLGISRYQRAISNISNVRAAMSFASASSTGIMDQVDAGLRLVLVA